VVLPLVSKSEQKKVADEKIFRVFDHKQVIYKKVDDVELKLHIFEPLKRESKVVSAIVFFHGAGGWPKSFYPQAKYFAERGMLAISAEYRMVKGGTSVEQRIKNGKSAIRWIRTHSNRLGVDPNRIVAAGGSRGGFVACSACVIRGCQEKNEDLKISSQPNAMVLFNPVLSNPDSNFSPIAQVRRDLPPTIIFHGVNDHTVPIEEVELFTKLMKESGNICELHSFEGEEHGFFNYHVHKPNNLFQKTLHLADEFLCRFGYLKGKPLTIDEE
jgi:acetyl esterase/lipase